MGMFNNGNSHFEWGITCAQVENTRFATCRRGEKATEPRNNLSDCIHMAQNVEKIKITYFSRAWASEGTVDPFPFEYMLGAELSRTCQHIKDDTDPVTIATTSRTEERRSTISALIIAESAI